MSAEPKPEVKKCSWCGDPVPAHRRFCNDAHKGAYWSYHRPVARIKRHVFVKRLKLQRGNPRKRVTRLALGLAAEWLRFQETLMYGPGQISLIGKAERG